MTALEIQSYLSQETGLKIGLRKLKGSMKHYIQFNPAKTKGVRPSINWDTAQKIKQHFDSKGLRSFVTTGHVEVICK